MSPANALPNVQTGDGAGRRRRVFDVKIMEPVLALYD